MGFVKGDNRTRPSLSFAHSPKTQQCPVAPNQAITGRTFIPLTLVHGPDRPFRESFRTASEWVSCLGEGTGRAETEKAPPAGEGPW